MFITVCILGYKNQKRGSGSNRAYRNLKGFSVRHISICAVNAVVPDDPQKELVVRRPELPIVSVMRGPRHAPVQQGLHGLRLQQPSLEPQWRAWPVEELCGELSKTSPSDFGAAVDVSRDVGISGNEAANCLGSGTGFWELN